MIRPTDTRRLKVWELTKRGIRVDVIAKLLGYQQQTIVNDQHILRMCAVAMPPDTVWNEGARIALKHDGWGKMPAGTFGTVVKAFDYAPGIRDYAVIWDTGLKDLVGEDQIRLLSPLEQLASVV